MGCGHSKSTSSRVSRTIQSYNPLPLTENEVMESLKAALATVTISESIDSEGEASMENRFPHESKRVVPVPLFPTASTTGESIERRGNVESFIIVWFGDSQSLELCKSDLQQIIYDIRTFQSDVEACLKFVQSVQKEKIFFIQSEITDDQIISEIHDLSQVEFIYFFTLKNQVDINNWDGLYSKFKGIFTDTLTLIEQLSRNTRDVDQNLLGALFLTATNEIESIDHDNELSASFMYAQLVTEVLVRLTDNNIEKMMTYCRAQYSTGDNIKEFDEFERDYNPSNAIWWYTRKGYMYKMLTTALRQQDILTIYKMHILIRDLHHQLIQLRNEQNLFDERMIFYRNQTISLDEFEKLRTNTGAFLFIRNFFSAYNEKDLALNFVLQSPVKSNAIAVLFEIEIDGRLSKNTPFANIDLPSSLAESHNEYLFFACSIFRIGQVKKMMTDGVWYVHLTMTIDSNPDIIQENMRVKHPIDELAYLFWNMEKEDEAQQICLDALSILDPSEIILRARLLTTLGSIQKDVSKSIPYFEEALALMITVKGSNHSDLAQYFANLGFSQRDLGRRNEAFTNIKHGLELEVYSDKPNLENMATFSHYMGHILADQGNYTQALIFHRNALNIQYKIYPSMHPQIAITLYIISNRYQNMEKFHEALPLLEKCLDIQLVSLSPGHLSLVSTYWKIANILYVMNRFEEALENLEKAIDHGIIGHSPEIEKYRQIAATLQRNIAMKKQKDTVPFSD